MPLWVKISMYLLIPLLWGLGVEYVFERARRRKRQATLTDIPQEAD